MLTIEELRKRMNDPVVRDHTLIRRAVEEMAQLPITRICKDSVVCSDKNEKLGFYVTRIICENLNMSEKDERISTLGKLSSQVYARRRQKKTYRRMCIAMAKVNSFFGLRRREAAK